MKYFFVIYSSLFLVFLTFTSCGGSYPNSKTEEVASEDDSKEEEEDQPKKKKKKSKKQVEEEEVYEEDAEELNSPKKNKGNEIPLEKIIGKWEDKDFPEIEWAFNKNGTLSYVEANIPDEDDIITEGKYELRGNKIYFKTKSSDGYTIRGNLEIVSVQENQIEILHYVAGNYGAERTLIRKY